MIEISKAEVYGFVLVPILKIFGGNVKVGQLNIAERQGITV